VCVCVALVIQH